MPMTLHMSESPAKRSHTGSYNFILESGQSLKIETSPHGDEILDFVCNLYNHSVTIRIDLECILPENP